MTQDQLDGITKARLVCNIADRAITHATDANYVAFVCAAAGLETLPDYAADSYAELHADRTIADLQAELNAILETPA